MIICVSILLAFWLSNWGEQQTVKERTTIALCNVKGELEQNYQLLTEDYIPRHRGLLEYVGDTRKQLQQQPSTDIPLIDRPIIIDHLSDTAWSLAMETGYLLHVDFGLATEVARVYSLQEDSYRTMVEKIISVVFAHQTETGYATVQSQSELVALFNEWHEQGKYLAYQYEQLFASDSWDGVSCRAAS